MDGGLGFDEADYLLAASAVRVDLNKLGVPQVISVSEGSDFLWNIDAVRGSAFNDTLIGNSSDNNLTGSGGNDSLAGGAGFDFLAGGAGNDVLNGGDGFDRADYFDATSSVKVDLSKHGVAQLVSASEGSDVLISIEAASGSAFNDTLLGDSAFNNLNGRGGDDSLQGGANQDFLVGGAGNDTLDGGSQGEFNEASFEDAPVGVIVNLSSGTLLGVSAGTAHDGFGTIDTLMNIAGIFGSESNDTIFGGFGSEFFEGMGGNDSIVGGSFGRDALEYFSSVEGVTADLSKQGSAQFISTTQGTDTFTGIEDIFGSFFSDSLAGDASANILWGRDGNDTLIGGGGADTLDGDFGNDQLVVPDANFFRAFGGEGFDRLVISGANVAISQSDVFNKLYNIEQIDLTGTGNNSLTLTALDVLQVSDNFQMQIVGDAGDKVTSQGQGWIQGGDVFSDGQTYHSYTASVTVPQGTFQASLLVDVDITLTQIN